MLCVQNYLLQNLFLFIQNLVESFSATVHKLFSLWIIFQNLSPSQWSHTQYNGSQIGVKECIQYKSEIYKSLFSSLFSLKGICSFRFCPLFQAWLKLSENKVLRKTAFSHFYLKNIFHLALLKRFALQVQEVIFIL